MPSRSCLSIYRSIAYKLAFITLILGLLAGISFMAIMLGTQKALMLLHYLTGEAFAYLIAPYLISLIRGFGMLILVFSLVLSLLFFMTGLLLSHTTRLETQLSRLNVALPSTQ